MRSLRLGHVFVLLPGMLAAGCESAPPEDLGPQSSNIRIDKAAEGNDPDSGGTRMCHNSEGHIFVLWVDDRDGQPAVWFNRSLGLGATQTWMEAAVRINRSDSNVWNPSIACTTEGVYAVWEDDRDGALENHQIYFSRSIDGGQTWLENDVLIELDEDGESMSLGPEIIAVGNDIYVAWFDNQNGAYDIMVAHSGDGGANWDNPQRVDSDDPAGSAYSAWPQIAATEAGQVYVVWEDSREGASDIYFARSENAASTFKEDERLDGGDDAGSANSFEPRIAADGNNIFVVWHDERNGDGRDVFLNYSGNGGADWGNNATRVDSDNAGFFNSLHPTVAADGSTGHVAWQDARETGYDVYYRQFQGVEPVAEEIRIDVGDSAGFHNSINAKAAFHSGNLIVAWEDARGESESGLDQGYNDLYYNFSSGNGTFSEADLRVDSIAPGTSFKIDLNVALFGNWVFAAWTDGRFGTSDIFFQQLELGNQAQYIGGEEEGNGGGGNDE